MFCCLLPTDQNAKRHTCVTDAFSLGGVRHINLSVRRGICHKSHKWQFCKIFSGKIFKNFRHINLSALATCWERWLLVLKTNMFTTSNKILSVSVFFIYHFCSYIRKPIIFFSKYLPPLTFPSTNNLFFFSSADQIFLQLFSSLSSFILFLLWGAKIFVSSSKNRINKLYMV